ncbi:MAG TPA: hypothetical protein VE197_04555, partial [Mycobacterium sp.]|nr:hypothetical protein [Mycobacterium sp.]
RWRGKMADPVTRVFWASWQDDGPLPDVHIVGAADAAIAQGRSGAERVRIRLGRSQETICRSRRA